MSLPSWLSQSPDAIASGGFLLLLTLLFLFRRLWLRLLGPVFVYEADRVARRGRTFLLRALYVFGLLIALYLVYPHGQEMTLNVASQFAERFTFVFLIVQAAVMMLLTPVYVGGAI